MISQFDHLTLYTPSLSKHRVLLESLGYTMRFYAPALKNPEVKKSLVTRFSPTHNLALFDLPGSLSIELIEEPDPSSACSCIMPIFDGMRKEYIENILENDLEIQGERFCEAKLHGLDAHILLRDGWGQKTTSFTSFVLQVQDLGQNTRLWQALGWKLKEKLPLVSLTFRSPLHAFEATLYLKEDASMGSPVPLDSYGFNYVALVSTSAHKERERLLAGGIKTTELEEHHVNGKALDVFFVMGSNVQPIEILGLH